LYNSKIKRIIVENFGSIEYAEIDFDESGIINLCGYNDSGKSMVIRMLSILLYDVHPTEQASFVKNGKEYWRGTLVFDDNVRISKTKMLTGASIWEMAVGEKILYTNKLASGFSAVKGVPAQIAAYLGVLQDEFTKQLLNVRFNTDKMFLIYTTGSENYKMLSTVLKSDVLAEASTTLIQAKNKLDQDVQNKNNTYNILVAQHNELDVAPKSMIEDLDSKVLQLTELNKRGKMLTAIDDANKTLRDADIYPELKAIDSTRIDMLQHINKSYADSQQVVQPELSSVDMQRLNMLQSIQSTYEQTKIPIQPELNSLDYARYQKLVDLQVTQANISVDVQPELNLIDTTQISAVCDLMRANNAYNSAVTAFNTIDAEYRKDFEELQKLAEVTGFKICKNCGSIVM
jgi:hypothetical protein